MMNIMIISPKIPYPLNEGGKISQFAIIDYLRRNHSVILILSTYTNEDEKNVDILKQLWPEVIIEKIRIWNVPNILRENILEKVKRSVVSVLRKIFHLAKGLIQSDNNLIFQYSEIDSPWIAQIAPVKSRKFIHELLNIVNKTKAEIIQIDFLDYADLVFVLPKEIKKVFVHHEIKYGRLATALDTIKSSDNPFNNYILNFVRSQEMNLLRLYDGVFVFSEEDRKKLLPDLTGNKIYVTPFPVLDSFFTVIKPELLKIDKLVFVGGEDHSPNKDAIEWYINEIGEKVKKHDDLILHVIGKWNKETIEKYKETKLVCFPGFVEDLVSYCENSIMVVPVRIGSGIRTKILYAMAQGVPVVSASVGCEGLGVIDKTDILIANSPDEFAEAIHSIITNPEVSYNTVVNAQRFTMEKFSQRAAGELRQQYLLEVTNKN